MIAAPNMPRTIATVVTGRLATLVELQTALSVRDLYDLLDVMAADAHNQHVVAEHFRINRGAQ